jgi:hypothetical protein
MPALCEKFLNGWSFHDNAELTTEQHNNTLELLSDVFVWPEVGHSQVAPQHTVLLKCPRMAPGGIACWIYLNYLSVDPGAQLNMQTLRILHYTSFCVTYFINSQIP